MKKLFLLLTISISLTASAQNWNVFPYQQKSYFTDDLYVMDSTKVNGQDTILYFRRNLNLQGAANCYKTTLQNTWYDNNMFSIDSLIQRNDTVFYKWNLSTTPFYFIPRATVGQSWTVTSTYSNNDYNQITITCASIQLETFFGVTDSVKTFTMVPNGSSVNQIPVSNFQMKLSKSHGLIEMVPFIMFLYHPQYNSFTSVKAIGIDSSGTTYGYRQPKFHDYFHLSVGDILLWQRHFDPDWIQYPDWTIYYQDSITQVINTPDSVVYTFDRATLDTANQITNQTGLTTKFTRTEFGNIVETAPNWIALGNNQFGQTFMPNSVNIWQSSWLALTIDTTSNDTTTTFSFTDDAYSIDTTNCQTGQVFDVSFDFTVDTRAGVTQYCYYNFAWDCTTLIGSRINGQQVGSIYLSTNDLTVSNNSSLKLFPNPTTDLLFIDNISQTRNSTFEIYNSIGKLIKSGNIIDKSVPTNDLSNGLYFIRIATDRGNSLGKFIKN